MIVGQENVGKTSLLNCLKNPVKVKPVKTLSTDGISIENFAAKSSPGEEPQNNKSHSGVSSNNNNNDNIDIELCAWDFAGQEVYYLTHQFFLSRYPEN